MKDLPPILSYPSCEFLGPVLPVKVHEVRGDVITSGTAGQADFRVTFTKTGDEETLLILDYGCDVSGVPIFNVDDFSPKTGVQLLAAYSEGLAAAYLEDGDGPFPFTSGANTLRAVPYNLSIPGPIEDFFMQGGQRWQAFRLRSPGTVVLTKIGFRPTAFHTPVENLPGYFRCSNELLNKVWDCGTWTGQINNIPARVNTPSFQPTILGTIVDSQRPSQYYHGDALRNYNVKCSAKILSSGLIFSVRNSTGFGLQIQFSIVAPGSSLVRTFWGMYDQEQITLYPIELGSKVLETSLVLDKWYDFEIYVEGDEEVNVSVDGVHVATLPQGKGLGKQPDGLDREISTPNGSFGFGTGKHQQAIFKNMTVYSLDGELLYSNSLTTNSVLGDFAVSTNPVAVVYDGAKRDRAVWLGDTITQSLVLFYTTAQREFMEGAIESVLSRQNDEGFFPIYTFPGLPMFDAQPQREPKFIYSFLTGSFSTYVVRVVWEFWWHTGDKICLKRWYPYLVKVMKGISRFLDERGLLVFDGVFGADSDYYNTTRTGASIKQNSLYHIALDRMSKMAASLGLEEDSFSYAKHMEPLKLSCIKYLWNDETHSFDAAESMRGELSEDGNAFALLSGICPKEKAAIVLSRLRALYTPNGVLSFPKGSRAMNAQSVVSPIMNSWHAQACLEVEEFEADAYEIIKMCWSPMVDESSAWYTKSFWEFSTPEGTPFMGKFCSLAHPFSAQPVQQIGAYVLGVRPTSPGWSTFIIEPIPNFCKDVEWAQGRIPTPSGLIEVMWEKTGTGTKFRIKVPKAITGELRVKGYTIDGKSKAAKLLSNTDYEFYMVAKA